jgi:membrane-associated phospholipid phosphatase
MMNRFSWLVVGLLLVGACGASPEAAPPLDHAAERRPGSEVLVAWNQLVLGVAEAEDGFLTLKGLRSVAMMHLAIHDALNAIDRRYATYRPVAPTAEADPLAATVAAAFTIASAQYPDQVERFEDERRRWLEAAAEGARRDRGRELGAAVAARVLAERQGDGWDSEAEYEWHPMAPGVYAEFAEHSGTPEGFVFGSGWAVAHPFLLATPSQFRSPPPPEIASPEYTAAFREVKEVGRYQSPSRTADQTHLAMWWKDFAENSHNRLARQLVEKEALDLWTAARLFALLNTSLYDAYVNVFDNKFFYNHWRPYTAIRWAAEDGNPDTEPDREWNNLHRHTYAFPSYPSAHGTACAAAMTVLADTFGDDYPFTMTTAEVDAAGPFSGKVAMEPPTRSFGSFSAAAEECALSRLYLGIHFRYDSTAGNELGRRIGRYAVEEFLTPIEQ